MSRLDRKVSRLQKELEFRLVFRGDRYHDYMRSLVESKLRQADNERRELRLWLKGYRNVPLLDCRGL